MGTPCMWESQRPHLRERSRDRKERSAQKTFWAREEVRRLGGFKRSLKNIRKGRCLVNGSLFFSIDTSKEGISDISCYGHGSSFKFFQVVKGGEEVSVEPQTICIPQRHILGWLVLNSHTMKHPLNLCMMLRQTLLIVLSKPIILYFNSRTPI